MLNGKDTLSLRVLEAFKQKLKLADIANDYNLSLDQVKRLKRFYNYSKQVHELVGSEAGIVFDGLGAKGIALSKYIKAKDAGALEDILTFVTEHTTRDELVHLTRLYDEKASRIEQCQAECKSHLIAANELNLKHEATIHELAALKESLLIRYQEHQGSAENGLLLNNIGQVEASIKEVEAQVQALQVEKREMDVLLSDIKAAKIQSFEEFSITSNKMSKRELLTHKALQSMAMKWLFKQGYVVASEVELPNKRTADVIGYKDGRIIIVEVKASSRDYERDTNWPVYLPFCHDFYFLVNFPISPYDFPPTGLIEVSGQKITKTAENRLKQSCTDAPNVIATINRALSKKIIYGY